MEQYEFQTPMRQRRKPVRRKFPARVVGYGIGVVLIGVFLFAILNKGDSQTRNSVSTVIPKPSATHEIKVGSGEVTMSFVGDVIFAGRVKTRLEIEGYDYPYTQVDKLLQSDVTIANMETPITNRGQAQYKEYTYQSTPLALPAFRQAGFDLVTLANNHILDYGVDGLIDTMAHLQDNNIAFVGAGKTEDDAYKPVIIERNGVKIAFIGLSRVVPNQSWKALNPSSIHPKGLPGVANAYDLNKPIAAIMKANKVADLVVVLPHWGIERQMKPTQQQIDTAHQYIDAGADLIVGSHPHVLQSVEKYKGKWIAYSMGNFLFTTNASSVETWNSAVLKATCKYGACEIQMVPIHNDGLIPRPMATDKAQEMFNKLTQVSPGIAFSRTGHVKGE